MFRYNRYNRLLAVFAILLGTVAHAEERHNVLFIAVDDLRPELGCYGHEHVKSPNIDRLAAEGTMFTRAYCQQAVCNPSRASLMSGLRPETLRVFDLSTNLRAHLPDLVTLPQLFKKNGYHAQAVGKIYHTGHGNTDDAASWSTQEKFRRKPRYGPEAQRQLEELYRQARKAGVKKFTPKNRPRGVPWEAPDIADEELIDGAIANEGIRLLRQHKDKPFFLAVGFLNPHLPFVAPKRYWDLYQREAIPLPSNPNPPKDAPSYAATNWGELRNYQGMPKTGPLSAAQARAAIHGYWAATSYIDAQVGKLLNELARLKLRKKTIVILWGDHGWQLGDHGFWCKHTNYEVAARVPLIISVPGQNAPSSASAGLVEFVDIYPTLAEACQLDAPPELEGTSFLPLTDDPNRSWKSAAFHLYPRYIRGQGRGMGRAMRTDQYRLVEWSVAGKPFREYELYDLKKDPQENVNVAGKAENKPLVARLSKQLHAGWKAAVPKGGAGK